MCEETYLKRLIPSQLGDFLRSRREQLTCNAVGLPDGQRRRTPGLRREEVAELAKISVDWYIRLEQGRTVNPSTTTIDALAAALRLSRAEHSHIHALARTSDRPAFTREHVPPAIRSLVDSLPNPAYVTGLRWDVLAWNTAAGELLVDFSKEAEKNRNILLYMFTHPRAKALFGSGWKSEAMRMLAQFRVTHDMWANDPAFVSLIKQLQEECPEFTAWWRKHDVRNGGAGEKQFNHPRKGLVRFRYTSFQANEDTRLKLVIYTPI